MSAQAESSVCRVETEFARDVRAGLSADGKRLACRWFYDDVGSVLFERICAVPEYYIPEAEREILAGRAKSIVSRMPADTQVVELGSGSSRKTRILLDAFVRHGRRPRYVPIDVSGSALASAAAELRTAYPTLDVVPIHAEYEEALTRLGSHSGRPPILVIWLGSSIGNLERARAATFLRRLRADLGAEDRLLVGIDLRKDRGTIERAYDDLEGITARFNRNLLDRINRELGGHFEVPSFRHRARYLEAQGRVEMHLVATRPMCVAIDDLEMEVQFEEGEPIHTEDCHKYSLGEIAALAAASNLQFEDHWLDGRGRFSVNVFAP